MYQFLKFEDPIPSCKINSLEFTDNKWFFIYALEVPYDINNENEKELIIYGHISDLSIGTKDEVHEESVNIKIKTLNDILNLLKVQREEDEKYRKIWRSENPEAIPNIITLENKSYSNKELVEAEVSYISGIEAINSNTTEFIGI